jgi:HSP20 family protein
MERKELTRKGPQRSIFDSGWMDRFFDYPINEFFSTGKIMSSPAVNVSESDKEYHISVAAPGLDKSDFKVETDDDVLTISAEKEMEEKEGKYNRREYNYSSWRRSFHLPDGTDATKIDAEYKNGELHIHIPRTTERETKNLQQVNIR